MSGALILSHPLYCQDVTFLRYTVVPSHQRAGSDSIQLQIISQYPLSVESQQKLVEQYGVASKTARSFARTEKLALQRTDLPDRLVLCHSPQALGDLTGTPIAQYGGAVVARVDLNRGIVYLGRRDPSDLYVELGKWFFYDRKQRWGRNRKADLRRLDMAERFASACRRNN